ncbi:MAG: tRNA1(Val) (adenine(37)-N6)-methyltransferase [Bacilli bacterium]
MEVINDLVGYKNLKIIQNTEWFSFSLDSVLLPYFVENKANYKKIVDFCTGNAPIPLILSRKFKSKIYGIELLPEICDLAIKSVAINQLQGQIEILNMNIKDVRNVFTSDSVDLITCNPPYFKETANNKKNTNIQKTIARHEVRIKLAEIIEMAKIILKNKGSLVMIHRTERLIEIIKLMKDNNIEPKRLCFIYPKQGTLSNMILIEGIKNAKGGLKVLSPIITHNDDGSYTDEVLDIFNYEVSNENKKL